MAECEICAFFGRWLSCKADWLRGLPGIVAEYLKKDLNPLPMTGLLLRNALLMRIVWLMLGINYSSFESSPPLPPCPPPPHFPQHNQVNIFYLLSYKIRIKLCEQFDTVNTPTNITAWLNYFPHSSEQQMHRAVVTCSVTRRRAKRLRASPLSPICILFCH